MKCLSTSPSTLTITRQAIRMHFGLENFTIYNANEVLAYMCSNYQHREFYGKRGSKSPCEKSRQQ